MNHHTKSDLKTAISGTVAFFTIVLPIGVLLALIAALCVVSAGTP